MDIPFGDVNVFAVIVGTVCSMLVGMAWYSPKLFGSMWMELVGKDEDDLQADMQRAFTIGITATLITTYLLAVILQVFGVTSLGEAALTALVLWACTQLPQEMHGVAWEQRPVELLYINAGYALVSLTVASVAVQFMSSLVT